MALTNGSAALAEAMNHALGEPLASASTMARVLTGQMSDAHAEAVESIVDALDRTEVILRDILEFLAGGDAVAGRVSRRRTNLKPLCERVVDSIQRRYPTCALRLDSDPRVEGQWDPDAIAVLLDRLVVNALEHGAKGCAVRISVRGLDDRAVLEVWNQGTLPADVPQHRIFEPFLRARVPRSGGGHGLGLGLYLAEQTVRAHFGQIDVRSDPGQGTTFRVSLPREAGAYGERVTTTL